MAFLLVRLIVQKSHVLGTKIVMGAILTIGVICVFIVALKCKLASPWIFMGNRCSGQAARWRTVAAFDILTEVALFAILVAILHPVQLSSQKKTAVIVGFAMRLL